MTSEQLFARAQKLIPGGVNSPVRAFRSVGGAPFFVKAARGATLITADDQILDRLRLHMGAGHPRPQPPRIKAAIAAALENGTSFGTPNPYEVEMAELIVSFVPSIQKVRMCNSGTEATMSAIRLARGFTKRDKIVKFAGCYHGHSDSLLDQGRLRRAHPRQSRQRRRAGVLRAAKPSSCPTTTRAALDAAFAANPGQIAGVIVEPYCGNVGFIMPDAGYLAAPARRSRAKHGALLIFDEVMTGFRLARGGVQEREQHHARPHLPRQNHRRRPARRRLRRPRRHHGPPRAARPRLPGRHAQRQPARHGRRHRRAANCSTRRTPTPGSMRSAASSATPCSPPPKPRASRAGRRSAARCSASFSRIRRCATTPTALKGDAKLFGRFFHACLADGVYLAPAPMKPVS